MQSKRRSFNFVTEKNTTRALVPTASLSAYILYKIVIKSIGILPKQSAYNLTLSKRRYIRPLTKITNKNREFPLSKQKMYLLKM